MGDTEDQTDTNASLPRAASRLPVLKLLYGPSSGGPRQWSLAGSRVELGREVLGAGDVRLAQDRKASARHARITKAGEALVVEDLGSRNQTFVNGHAVDSRPLSDGDVLRIGDTLLLLRWETAELLDASHELAWLHQLVAGCSPAVCQLRHDLVQVAPSEKAILIGGESGTGKDLAAQAIHRLSGRRGALVVVNCATVPVSLAESTFFGHVEGAFTGAKRSLGRLREADGGTLFLDELGELPRELQPKLLRVLEDGLVTPIGASQPVAVKLRVISATNRNVRHAAPRGEFRHDLLARLSTLRLELPPLRSRREDILPLFQRFLGMPELEVPARLAEALLIYRWPLNIRELMGFAEFAKTFVLPGPRLDVPRLLESLSSGTVMDAHSTEPDAQVEPASQIALSREAVAGTGNAAPSTSDEKPPIDREVLLRLMNENDGVIARVAERLKRSRRQVSRWLAAFGIDPSAFRRDK